MKAAPSGTVIGQNPVETLTKQYNWVFAGYMLLLALVLVFTYLVWKFGNRVQEAIQADANARIEQAKTEQARLNERAQKLEQGNLTLRADLNTEVGKVAGLQKDVIDAKAKQQAVEVELGKQREKTATAERSLLELQRRAEPRRISPDQRTRLLALLSTGPKGKVTITAKLGDSEALAFAQQVAEVINAAAWPHVDVREAIITNWAPGSLAILVASAHTAPPHAVALQRAFFSVGFPLEGFEHGGMLSDGEVEIWVGSKSQ